MAEALRVITGDTKRDVEANLVLAQFAKTTEEMSVECDRMSAFFIVTFDDQGNLSSSLYMGTMFPMPSVMIPGVVQKCAEIDVYSG